MYATSDAGVRVADVLGSAEGGEQTTVNHSAKRYALSDRPFFKITARPFSILQNGRFTTLVLTYTYSCRCTVTCYSDLTRHHIDTVPYSVRIDR